MAKVFHLKFNKEADGAWYIEFPGYPFAHHNLRPVADEIPVVYVDGRKVDVDTAWLCPVTLLVLFQYPKKINLYIPENV